MPTYTYLCSTCDSHTEEFYKYSERPEEILCACGGTASHTITPVGLMVKEAYLDGTRRPGFDRMREASKLNKEVGKQKTSQEKDRIRKEIQKLGVRVSK